jgi:hypothetical protein
MHKSAAILYAIDVLTEQLWTVRTSFFHCIKNFRNYAPKDTLMK